jgi:hypothetical protein
MSKILLIAVILIYSLSILKFHHVRFTADSMLYFSIAEKYLNGDYANAINGYWGPLLAWLFVPFLALGFSDIATLNMVNFLTGIVTFVAIWRLSQRFDMSEKIRSIVILTSLPLVLKISLVQPMDFLLLCLLLLYLNMVFREDFGNRAMHGGLSGVFGAAAYLTKAYAFPFFLTHYFMINVLHLLRAYIDRKKILTAALAGFTFFFLISGGWIYLISSKYGHLTFSTMRDTNFNAPGPDEMGGGLEFGVPVFYEGFFEPPNETAFVIWEDPSYLRGNPWSPLESVEMFKHFIKLLLKNVSQLVKILTSFSFFSIAVVTGFLLILTQRDTVKEIFYMQKLLYPLLTVVLFTSGYLLFHLEERYLWLDNVLLLLMGGQLLNYLFQSGFFTKNMVKNTLIVFFLLSFIFEPSRYIARAGSGNMDVQMYNLSKELRGLQIHGKIASNRDACSHDAWHKTFRLAYWLKCRYYGQRGVNMSDEELRQELEKYDIDYYFVWGESGRIPDFIGVNRELTGSRIPGLKIFSLK